LLPHGSPFILVFYSEDLGEILKVHKNAHLYVRKILSFCSLSNHILEMIRAVASFYSILMGIPMSSNKGYPRHSLWRFEYSK